jgi:hypothetical protein
MLAEDKYFKTLTQDELWQRYCGFFDLSIDDFMDIQKGLLMNQIEMVSDSTLGKKIMGDQKPRSVDEFRQVVPLTTYDDYEPYLSEKQEDTLAVKPYLWTHSAGRGGSFKWVPHSSEIVDKAVRSYLAGGIIASCKKKGEVNISPGARILVILAPPPYNSGELFLALVQRFSARVMPPLEAVEASEFQERIQSAFQMALKDGVDFIGALASVLVRIGEEFTEQVGGMKFSLFMLHPKVSFRLLRAWLRAKIEKRVILPKDIWRPKGIFVSGVDTSIYKDSVAYYWGVTPVELYSGTEAQAYALEAWTRKGMVFLPHSAFFEFIPYEESLKLQEDKHYQPSTVLLNEVEEGKLYEVVITQLYGMPLLRYRLNDIIKVIAIKDDQAGINLPQIAFQRRVGEVINLGGLVNLDEKVVWQAIANTGIGYTEWAACKEYDQNQSFLRLYIELKEEKETSDVEAMIDEQLTLVDTDYKDIHSYLSIQPVRVTLLSPGTFQRYTEEKIAEGADLAHLKPAHMNPPEPMVQRLLQLSEVGSEK